MKRGMARAERLREMERLYLQHLGGLTDIEVAQRLGVDRTTVYRDRQELESEIPFIEVETGRYTVDRMSYLSSIRVNLNEAMALYLAARRMSRHTRTSQLYVANALEKLAAALRQPMTERLVKAASAVLRQESRPESATVLETLAQGWAERIKVRIVHQALHSRRPWTYVLSPYLIEPSLWSDGTYVVGHSDVHNGLSTFKVERIERAHLTTERYDIPEDFDEEVLFRYAWGIWYGDEEPVMVVLRFAPGQAARRLRESIWHPTQEISDTEAGGCVWAAQVAEVQEMIPWIRGWGADVEVLEPLELRERMMGEARRLAESYGWQVSRLSSASDDTLGQTFADYFGD